MNDCSGIKQRSSKVVWRVWSKDHGTISAEDLTPAQWAEIQAAAGFRSVSGRRAGELVAEDGGRLWLIDSCNEAHAVDPLWFVGVAP